MQERLILLKKSLMQIHFLILYLFDLSIHLLGMRSEMQVVFWFDQMRRHLT